MFNDQPNPNWQSDDYQQARSNFLSACWDADVEVKSYVHPLQDSDNRELATDVARFGLPDATKLLVMVSGVHGVEGFSGSATQVGWIEEQRHSELPKDTAVIMIHLINPWGAAYLRRYNEDNVDLCRNCLDFSQPLPRNESYADVHSEMVLGEELGIQGQNAGEYLGSKVSELGLESTIDLFMGGQYDFSDGFSFGGQEAVWSNTVLRKILSDHNEHVLKVCALEFHTGLGPWGYGALITMHTGRELERINSWFGPWTMSPMEDAAQGDNKLHKVNGHTINAYTESFPEAEVSAVTLEFGSYPSGETLALMLQEHLLVQSPDHCESGLLSDVKAKMLEYHHPQDWEWRSSFWCRSMQVIRQALNGLARDNAG